jgi:dTDP-glucose 4,6-dehydratase
VKFYITGEKGLIARNLRVVLEEAGHKVISDADLFTRRNANMNLGIVPKTREICVWRNSEDVWAEEFQENGVDVVIHNAAVVGTDVVALNPQEAVLSNVQGTHNIVRAANRAKAAVCYLGTTVIYDTAKYQDEAITEESVKNPRTYYAVQKLAGEDIVRNMAEKWSVVRPLFAFGGNGDMNSLIAKSIYAAARGKTIDMFLDPDKVKDYLHVSDFCRAVELVCRDISGKGWGTDWNVAAETPLPAGKVVNLLENELSCSVERLIKWYPSTDYLGNHRLSAEKIRAKLGWKPALDLSAGILETAAWINQSLSSGGDYNPLKHLEEAAAKGTDLLQHFPKMR